MTNFRPFRGIFYDDPASSPDDGALDVSPVIGDSPSGFAAARLAADPALAGQWLSQRRLRIDDEPALYVFRAGRRNTDGTPVQVAGVFGLAQKSPATAESPQLFFSPTVVVIDKEEFDHLLVPAGVPVVTATDATGSHFRVWATRQMGVIETISDAVAENGPVPHGLVAATTAAITLPAGLVFARS